MPVEIKDHLRKLYQIMYHTFELTIGNSNNESTIEFDVFQTDIAQLWANEIAKNYPLYETDRFTNWPNSTKSKAYYEYYLKLHMNNIQEYGHPIAIENFDFQDALNLMHKHFEDLRGHIDNPSNWYKSAPPKVKNSVDRFNVLIHEYENLLAEEKQNFRNPTIVCTFKDRPKIQLEEYHYKHFTHRWKKGTVYINYCEVGKPLLDVFKDNDDHAEAIRPQSTYSADFMIKFGPTVPERIAVKKENDFFEWYKQKGYNFKHLSLGMIPVAQIKKPVDLNKFKNYNEVINVTCKK